MSPRTEGPRGPEPRWGVRLRHLIRPRELLENLERDVELELQHHVQMRVDELVAEGVPEDEARRTAALAFGDLERYRAECLEQQTRRHRPVRRGPLALLDRVASIGRDLTYAARGLRRAPGFALAVVLTLALGIGANTAIFTVVDTLLLRPVPYPDADELFRIGARYGEQGFSLHFFPWEGARGWVEANDVLTGLSVHGRTSAVRTDGGQAEQLVLEALGAAVIPTLGMAPRLGRAILPSDEDPAGPDVVVLSHRYWSESGADPGVIGSTVTLDDRLHTVVGVMPARFHFPWGTTDGYVPLRSDGTALGRPLTQVQLIGRLPEGPSTETALERLTVLAEGLQELGPSRGAWTPTLNAVNDPRVQSDVARGMWVVFGAVGLMLLVAVVNGVNLLLARSTARGREIAVRMAIGASRARVVRQLMTEALLLAVASGLAATWIAVAGVEALLAVAPVDLTWFNGRPPSIGLRPLLFTFGLSVVTGLGFGIVPALRTAATAGRSTSQLSVYASSQSDRRRLRSGLVVAQVALSLALLFGAALLGRSFARLVDVDPGFDPEQLHVLNLNLGDARYPTSDDVFDFSVRMADRLRAIPGVTSVARSIGVPPSTGVTFGDRLEAQDRPDQAVDGDWVVAFSPVDEHYVPTLGARILSGRNFQPSDYAATTGEGSPRPVLIDRELAVELWNSTGVAGRRFRLDPERDWYDVVGVIEDLKLMGLEDRHSPYAMLLPLTTPHARGFVSFSVRSPLMPAELFPQVRAAVAELDPRLPVHTLAPATDELQESVARPRFFLVLMSVFAGTALALTAVGVYGVLAFAVGQRTREIGIRVALGASAARVRRAILADGMRLAVGGVLLGTALSIWGARVLEGLLFDTSRADPVAVVVVVVTMLATALAACLIPAGRATRVDPVRVLKSE